MKLSDLTEAPLPDDWDKSVYKPTISYAQRIKYAVQRAQKLGGGSSRVAFEISYKGRPTSLKIAKNIKGMAQNEAEVELLNDYFLKGIGIVIPLIDYDEEHSQPVWVHTEKAQKLTANILRNVTSGWDMEDDTHKPEDRKKGVGNIRDVFNHVKKFSGTGRLSGIHQYHGDIANTEFIHRFTEFMKNYTHVPMNDFSAKANWGVYKGEPVIIDLGFSSDVRDKYYS